MKQWYCDFPFKKSTLAMIRMVNAIVDEYAALGLKLTLRQIFYQLVSRGVIPNTEQSYDSTGKTVNNGKLAGMIDWDAIEDRTRMFRSKQRYTSPADLMDIAERSYHIDLWKDQDKRVFVIIEKEALYGVFQPVCFGLDVPLLAARGYPSGSVLRDFAQRQMLPNSHQTIVFLHFGDHDPSGIDMSRDLEDRLTMFGKDCDIEFHRIALNMNQVKEHKPPPNPAKVTDSRYASYLKTYGHESWELDALDPRTLQGMTRRHISNHMTHPDRFEDRRVLVERGRNKFKLAKVLVRL